MDSIVRVLHVIAGMGSGGAEAFIMNIYRNIDRRKVQFDFLLRIDGDHFYANEIEELGGRIYITPSFPRHAISNWRAVKSFLKQHQEYKIIHVHANALMYMTPLILAKKQNIPCRIIHSHNTKTANAELYDGVHRFNKGIVGSFANQFFACSNVAGEWMFGKRDYTIIQNAIDTQKFDFSHSKRAEMRAELGINDRFVIGHVGRFTYQKNHEFLLDIFEQMLKCSPLSVLLLVGEGEGEKAIRQKAASMGILENIKFLGVRQDIAELMQAMDIFVLPSRYEGLPVVGIEAQATGLQCFFADTITSKLMITDNVCFMDISHSPTEWADAILTKCNYERKSTRNKMVKANYDIVSEAEKLQHFYEQAAHV